MSALAASPTRPTRAATVRALAVLEARRYARHPVFLTGTALMAVAMVLISKDMAKGTGDPTVFIDATILPGFFLGLLGVFVGVQLARSTVGVREPLEACPTDGVARTTALCLSTVVPGAAALFWLGWIYAVSAAWVARADGPTAGALTAIRLAGVVCAVGGPLFGVMVGRWTRFPGASLLAAVVLYGWTVLSGIGLALSTSRLGSLVYLSAPFVSWTSSDETSGITWIVGGSPTWYLVYITMLSALAATAAMLHEARGAQRTRLLRVFGVIAALALVSLALAVAPEPVRIPL